VDGATGARERLFELGTRALFAVGDAGFPVVAAGSLWLTVPKLGQESEPQTLWRLNAQTGRVIKKIPIGVNPSPPLAAAGFIWIISVPANRPNELSRLDPAGRKPVRLRAPENPWALAAGANSVWVGRRYSPVIVRLDPATARLNATIPLPGLPRGIAFGAGSIWVTTTTSLVRIDLARNTITRTIRLYRPRSDDEGPTGVAYLNGSVWISIL
jgi:sugar lactone lactonase YvrE